MLGSFAPRVLAWLYLSLVMALFPFGNVMMTGHWLLSWQLLHPEKTAASTSPRVVKYIQSQTDPLDYVLFWRPKSCREVWYSQRRCPSKYFNTCFQYMPDFRILRCRGRRRPSAEADRGQQGYQHPTAVRSPFAVDKRLFAFR